MGRKRKDPLTTKPWVHLVFAWRIAHCMARQERIVCRIDSIHLIFELPYSSTIHGTLKWFIRMVR